MIAEAGPAVSMTSQQSGVDGPLPRSSRVVATYRYGVLAASLPAGISGQANAAPLTVGPTSEECTSVPAASKTCSFVVTLSPASGSFAIAANWAGMLEIAVGFAWVPQGRGRTKLKSFGIRGAVLYVTEMAAVQGWNFFHCSWSASFAARRPNEMVGRRLSATSCR